MSTNFSLNQCAFFECGGGFIPDRHGREHPNGACPPNETTRGSFFKSLRGCDRGGERDRAAHLTRAHLELAKRTLAAFDLVELTEDLAPGDAGRHLDRFFDCPTAQAWPRHDRRGQPHGKLPARFHRRFHRENALDEELYDFAVDLVRESRAAADDRPCSLQGRRQGVPPHLARPGGTRGRGEAVASHFVF